jgi:magnesium chelatase subunit H
MQVTDAEIAKLFGYLEFCLQQVVADNELGALVDALDGSPPKASRMSCR